MAIERIPDVWPVRVRGTIPKPSRAERKAAAHVIRKERRQKESRQKQQARKRDRHRCRWPLCGCRERGLVPEVSHDRHKGMGGNPAEDRSAAKDLLTLCVDRHQSSVLSRHAKTIRWRPLVRRFRNNGPLVFEVQREALRQHFPTLIIPGQASNAWVALATERVPGELEPLHDWQRAALLAIGRLAK